MSVTSNAYIVPESAKRRARVRSWCPSCRAWRTSRASPVAAMRPLVPDRVPGQKRILSIELRSPGNLQPDQVVAVDHEASR